MILREESSENNNLNKDNQNKNTKTNIYRITS